MMRYLKAIPWVAAVAFAIAFGAAVLDSRARTAEHRTAIEAVRADLTAAEARAAENAKAVAALQSANAEMARLSEAAASTRRLISTLSEDVRNAIAQADDGPAAPVLNVAADGLWKLDEEARAADRLQDEPGAEAQP